MVSFNHYKTLNEGRQAEILWEEGVYLGLIRSTKSLNVELYALHGFYVELYFDRITEDPVFIRPFNGTIDLEPYLDLIDIHDVLKNSSDFWC
jgi:hypothetical protein